jgi:hypothetical protein
MELPTLFLDIDGVIAIPRPGRKTVLPSRNCIEQLNRITDATSAKLVISSGRRYSPDLEMTLAEWGVQGPIIGRAPIFGDGMGGRRGEEIAEWLDACVEPVQAFIILDDDPDIGQLRPHLILTGWNYGLTDVLADEAIRKLIP